MDTKAEELAGDPAVFMAIGSGMNPTVCTLKVILRGVSAELVELVVELLPEVYNRRFLIV